MTTILHRSRAAFAAHLTAVLPAYMGAGAEGSDGPQLAAQAAHAIERPKDPSHGLFAYPTFSLSKSLRKAPPLIAKELTERLNQEIAKGTDIPISFQSVGGYVNLSIDGTALISDVLGALLKNPSAFLPPPNDKLILIEYSSPNIAKPFGVGHLRSTVIGSALTRIFRRLGYEVIGINYPGDWGTQFGKMIVAYRSWGTSDTLSGNSVRNLLDLYVKFHSEAENNPALNEQARQAFLALERGEADAVALWQQFSAISYAEFDRIYARLGIQFDRVIGESFFNDKMEDAIRRFETAGLTSMSDGAEIVDLHDEQLPPLLLKKRDGATLYATRDLAGLLYRWEHYRFAQSLYVVGTAQADHFRQCLLGISLLEQAEQKAEHARMTGRVKHVEFGWVKFGTEMMSTRRGNIVLLEEVLDRAVAMVREKMSEKGSENKNSLREPDVVAEKVGVGAVIFSQLAVKRMTDVNFRYEDVLNFEGETGPYLQYTHARLSALLRHWNRPVTAGVAFDILNRPEEVLVVRLLAEYPDALADAARQYDPYYVAQYLLSLTSAFNKVYQRKDAAGKIEKLLTDDQAATAARMALVESVRTVLADGLAVLGLAAPAEM